MTAAMEIKNKKSASLNILINDLNQIKLIGQLIY